MHQKMVHLHHSIFLKGGLGIGEKIGWSETSVYNYNKIINVIPTLILDLCKQYQNGRVGEKTTTVVFDFIRKNSHISIKFMLKTPNRSCD